MDTRMIGVMFTAPLLYYEASGSFTTKARRSVEANAFQQLSHATVVLSTSLLQRVCARECLFAAVKHRFKYKHEQEPNLAHDFLRRKCLALHVAAD